MSVVLCEWVTCIHNSCQKPGGKGQCNAEFIELKHKEVDNYDEWLDTLHCTNYVKKLK